MDTSKNDVMKHVKSAKQWLEKAEGSFERHSAIKGRLNLLLAEAEMQQLREKRQRSSEYIWWQQLSAVAVAVVIGIGILCMWPKIVQPSPIAHDDSSAWIATVVPKQASWLSQQATPLVLTAESEHAVPAVEKQALPQREEEMRQNEKTLPINQKEISDETHSSAQTVVLNQQEIQQAVRDANRSLRGK